MTEFAKRPDLIVELRAAGEEFLASSRTNFSERNRETDDRYRFCRLIPDEKLRNMGQTVIADLVTVPAKAQHVTLMMSQFLHGMAQFASPLYRTLAMT